MIPSRRLLLILAAIAALGLIVAIADLSEAYWWTAIGLVFFAAGADAVLARLGALPSVERQMPRSMSLSSWVEVPLVVKNTTRQPVLEFQAFDHYPQGFATEGLPQTARVKRGFFVEVPYRARPTQRGAFQFPACDLRIHSPLGLWWARRTVKVSSDVRVYPNYSTISKLLAYEVDNRLQLAGVRMSRRRGEGIEFHQLRDYRDGDSMRAIDWKATSRMSRLIAREYQDERDQQIVFLLDAGRRMLAKDGELSHFDHALNSMLLLSYIALRQGDAAGVMVAGSKRSWLPPRKGLGAINEILNHVYDTEPKAIEIDYLAAATELAVRQRRRSLVVILTNVREEDSEDLRAATGLLRNRHLVILASLRESTLDDHLEMPVHNFDQALTYAATNQYMESRRESQNLLRAGGVFVEDCLCDDLPSAITNRYLSIKRAGLL